MIEFKGEPNGKCLKYMLMSQKISQTFALAIGVVIVAIPVTIIGMKINPSVLPLFFVPMVFALLCSFFLSPTKKEQKGFIPTRIFIDLNEGTIVHECPEMERFHMIESVKVVLDFGEWYHIKFYYADRDPYFVLQKNLLTEGTIEEFEKLFKGKINIKIK